MCSPNTICDTDLDVNQELNLTNSLKPSLSLSNDYTNEDVIYFSESEELIAQWDHPGFIPILLTLIVTFIIGVTGNLIVIWIMTGMSFEGQVINFNIVKIKSIYSLIMYLD